MLVPAHDQRGLFFAIFSGTKVLPGFSQLHFPSLSGRCDIIAALPRRFQFPDADIVSMVSCGFFQLLSLFPSS